MARALLLLALVAVGCVLLAHAEQTESPASKLQDALNSMQDTVLADPIALELDANELNTQKIYQERMEAYAEGNAEWYNGESADLAMVEMDKKKATKAVAKKNFDKEVQTLVKQGLITADVAKRILALKSLAQKKKATKKAKKAKKAGKKGKKFVPSTGISRSKGKAYKKSKRANPLMDEAGMPIRSLQLTTATNSNCFACQYFIQRTLGALLGPFYSPNNSGPHVPGTFTPGATEEHTAEPLTQWKQFASASTTPEALTDSEEAKSKFHKTGPFALPHTAAFAELDAEADEMAAIEISSIAHATFEEPEPAYAVSQYNKWEAFLPAHMRVSLVETEAEVDADADAEMEKGETESEVETETETEAEGDRPKKAAKKAAPKKKAASKKKTAAKKKAAPKKNFSKSILTQYGQFFSARQRHAVKAFFSDLCNRRVPSEFQPSCASIYKNLDAILEELSTGDRADEVCIRHNMCPKSSYVHKASHTALRQNA